MMAYQIVKKPGKEIEVSKFNELSLDKARELIGGGYIEIIQLRHYELKYRNNTYVLIVDEAARIKKMQANICLEVGDTIIYGPLVLVKLDAHGEVVGLSESEVYLLRNFIRNRKVEDIRYESSNR